MLKELITIQKGEFLTTAFLIAMGVLSAFGLFLFLS